LAVAPGPQPSRARNQLCCTKANPASGRHRGLSTGTLPNTDAHGKQTMSDKKESKPAAEAPKKEETAPKKGGLPIKLFGIVGVVMLIEAGALFFVFKSMKPKPTNADVHAVVVANPEGEKSTELKVLEEKFQNMQTGKVWFWDISVFVQIKQKHAENVKKRLEARAAEINEEVSRLVARAQHAQLKEPDRQTLSKQVSAVVMKMFEPADEKAEVLIDRVIIARCRGIPFD